MKIKKTIIPIISILIIVLLVFTVFSGYFKEEKFYNDKPTVKIQYPTDGSKVSKIVTISGIANDPNGNQTIKKVEMMIDETWFEVEGTSQWSYTWNIFNLKDDFYNISVRAWDGVVFSDIDIITVEVFNPEVVKSDSHKWAIFIVAANFPEDEESKLGNGGLYLAEEMVEYFIENYSYPTSNMFILFDDGWVRNNNGLGEKIQTLQQRYHKYDITYSAATKEIVLSVLKYIINESNKFEDSEVFIWVSGHGYGDNENTLTGGKIFERSAFFLWGEEIMTDKELDDALTFLQSRKTCIIVDACFSGGFADKTILSFPEVFISSISNPGRVVIAGTSKFRIGYASLQYGPLFTQLWYEGIRTGDADGFRPGFRDTGRPTRLNLFKDGSVSVEEAFYYARYVLKNTEELKDYNKMEPQINDQYPRAGNLFNMKGLVLGQ
ncbi:MAG: Ig-like domain-containing protein [Candidatus Thermoplasmatota archaeon]|nr:Ig-like domain-containing protein [Candidatus Thermoplasmatota archaeon]